MKESLPVEMPIFPSQRKTSSTSDWFVGIDENGLGPMLGPMITTGVAFSSEHECVRPQLTHSLISDSKAVMAHGDDWLGEAWARALLKRLQKEVSTPIELLNALLIDNLEKRVSLCPESTEQSNIRAMCCGTDSSTDRPVDGCDEQFVATNAQVQACEDALVLWEKQGVFVRDVKLRSHCARLLNHALAHGENKLLVNLHTMESLLDCFLRASPKETSLRAVCGKVGGFMRYQEHFRSFEQSQIRKLKETRPESRYMLGEHIEVSFLQDADATDSLVSLASLVGKSVREQCMRRQHRYFQLQAKRLEKSLTKPMHWPRPVSGYHDSRTKARVDESEELRKRIGMPIDCFIRQK